MTRHLVFFTLVLILALFAAGAYFLWVFMFSGSQSVMTALAPVPEDISKLIKQERSPLSVPEDFTLKVFANLQDARDLENGPAGAVFASSPNTGKVVLFRDEDGDGVSDTERLVAENLNNPHGLFFRCEEGGEDCNLYIAEEDKLSVFSYNLRTHKAINPQKLLDLPAGGRHTTRSLAVHPENSSLMLISVGSSCDVCLEEDARRGAVLFYNLRTGVSGEYATGLRNAVFMTENTKTGEVWVTEMGRDMLGDNLPPDEINILQREGDYGWPFCYGKNKYDTEFDGASVGSKICGEKIASHIDIQAHSAPLGLDFIPETENVEASTSTLSWPEEYQGDLLVGLHGSWNRSTPVGYKVVRYDFKTATTSQQESEIAEEDFITGWLSEGRAFGRPVDVLARPEGTLYISDDKAGLVYSLQYTP